MKPSQDRHLRFLVEVHDDVAAHDQGLLARIAGGQQVEPPEADPAADALDGTIGRPAGFEPALDVRRRRLRHGEVGVFGAAGAVQRVRVDVGRDEAEAVGPRPRPVPIEPVQGHRQGVRLLPGRAPRAPRVQERRVASHDLGEHALLDEVPQVPIAEEPADVDGDGGQQAFVLRRVGAQHAAVVRVAAHPGRPHAHRHAASEAGLLVARQGQARGLVDLAGQRRQLLGFAGG